MSFEGIAHHICANGHLWEEDAMAELYRYNRYEEPLQKCPFCGAVTVWTHVEDETNGFQENDPMNNGEIKKWLKTPPVMEAVNIVSQKDGRVIRQAMELISPETYSVPTTFGKVCERRDTGDALSPESSAFLDLGHAETKESLTPV